MKKLTIVSDVICIVSLIFILIVRINDSEVWFKIIMVVIILLSLIRLIYHLKKINNLIFRVIQK